MASASQTPSPEVEGMHKKVCVCALGCHVTISPLPLPLPQPHVSASAVLAELGISDEVWSKAVANLGYSTGRAGVGGAFPSLTASGVLKGLFHSRQCELLEYQCGGFDL